MSQLAKFLEIHEKYLFMSKQDPFLTQSAQITKKSLFETLEFINKFLLFYDKNVSGWTNHKETYQKGLGKRASFLDQGQEERPFGTWKSLFFHFRALWKGPNSIKFLVQSNQECASNTKSTLFSTKNEKNTGSVKGLSWRKWSKTSSGPRLRV